ncbi:carotenoid biosynthesis protein [Pontibacter qinzhouensis]|uniref:Carotenoid biosynthesis protein n=1 Tax=Pontibacter qinzhouensis TaxID=2603253 RepID=A0A5C8KB75_9BACT|nr:carotenoid biosynthesis protein [Pontibacter qinzhouensis]TXK51312.1 carotenoid biosynthesis protein [Pontibacter qinzhouensis]
MPDTTFQVSKNKAPRLFLKKYGLPLAVGVLVIFHAVGFWGLGLSGRPEYFQSLTPLNLLLTNVLLFSFHKGYTSRFLVFAFLVFAAGFLAEVLGVHTGFIFGNYSYGSTLGTKLWEVPLLIGVNWLMLVYATGTMVHKLPLHWFLKAITGAMLLVLLDYFLEPVAITYDFWSWHEQVIPLSNFRDWFGLSLLLQVLFQKFNFYKKNPVAPYVYLVQLLFFIALYIIL